MLLDDIRAALDEKIDEQYFNDEGRALFRVTWDPLSTFANPRSPKKGKLVPKELKLEGVDERERSDPPPKKPVFSCPSLFLLPHFECDCDTGEVDLRGRIAHLLLFPFEFRMQIVHGKSRRSNR